MPHTQHYPKPARPAHGDPRRPLWWGCICVKCTDCQPAPHQLRPAEPTLTVRQVRALIAYGYAPAVLAEELGCRTWWPEAAAHGRPLDPQFPLEITRGQAEAVDLAYWRLIDAPEPVGGRASFARVTLARRHGWDGPDAWCPDTIDDPAAEPWQWRRGLPDYDWVVVYRAVRGHYRWGDLDSTHRRETIRVLRELGRSDSAIARLLKTSSSTVRDWWAEHGEGPTPEGAAVYLHLSYLLIGRAA